MADLHPGGGGRALRDRGHVAYHRRAWAGAYAMLSAADGESPLEPADLDLLATAAYLVEEREVRSL